MGHGLERVYHKYLKPSTDVLNKHMSIGFTVPFLSLITETFAGRQQVGLLSAAFVIDATVAKGCAEPEKHLEPKMLDRFRKHLSDVSTLCTLSGYASDTNALQPCVWNESCRHNVDSRLTDGFQTPLDPESVSTSQASSQPSTRLRRCLAIGWTWTKQNAFLTFSILLFLGGIPLSSIQQNDLLLDTGFLFTVWLTFTTAQTTLKQHTRSHGRHQQPSQSQVPGRTLAIIATALNPVLWTSLFLLCYGLAKSRIQDESTSSVVARFKTNNTVSDIIAHHITMPDISNLEASGSSDRTSSSSYTKNLPVGAGDIATSILNAGIVAWGFKLFEYRNQIFSRGGLTVLCTSALAAIFNIIAWPLFAHQIGVRPAASDLSFAARSVTIALGVPAMKSLGGDAGVNAVGVVVNGICFQLVAGCFVDGSGLGTISSRWRCALESLLASSTAARWVRSKLRTTTDDSHTQQHTSRALGPLSMGLCIETVAQNRRDRQGISSTSSDPASGDGERPAAHPSSADNMASRYHSTNPSSRRSIADDNGLVNAQRSEEPQSTCRLAIPHALNDNVNNSSNNTILTNVMDPTNDATHTVAAGVTIGVNAAAMGTVHLYEQNSPAAAYSALTMTMFGVLTVLFTVHSPMIEWLVGMVGG
ncbi:hypothetical protein BD289DRAFT_507740 [Coniella lustricola]|uniref:LrgB-like family-domain-containing protein n=1 Tax=Coniella lustricola TaxID=2025994 RepID=A0A2T3A1H0_9PEZI|nr:hypothetical protein BD289DRAFT_507740 [Coniella lustricola]